MTARMLIDGYNAYCGSLPHTTHVVQWGGADVWKVAGKVFAIAHLSDAHELCVSFKCSPITFEMLKDQPGIIPAPYLASRGMIWLQRTTSQTMSDADLKHALSESYRLVALGLSKKRQRELQLNLSVETPTSSRTAATKRGRPLPTLRGNR